LIAVNPPKTGRRSIPPARTSGSDSSRDAGNATRSYDDAIGAGKRRAKLTDDKVRQLRARRAAGLTYRQLAAEFGISDLSACAVVNRKTWAHVI
jgi:hypothetical protein